MVKNLSANVGGSGNAGSIRVRKISWRGKWQPASRILSGKSHEQRSLVGYSPQGCKESDRQSMDNSYLSGAFGNSNQHLLFKTYPTLLCFSSDTSERSFSVSLVPSNRGFPQHAVIIIFFSHSIYTPWIILHILGS